MMLDYHFLILVDVGVLIYNTGLDDTIYYDHDDADLIKLC